MTGKLKKTVEEGLGDTEYVNGIHIEIPVYAYKAYKETKYDHRQIYLKGLITVLTNGREHLTDEKILEMNKALHQRITKIETEIQKHGKTIKRS